MPTQAPVPPQLISMPEIAELARVHRPVVTTWRRRHADFPAPVSDDRGRPLFDARRVVDWLVETGRADRDQIEPDLRLHLLVCLTGGALSPRELASAITALICLRHLDDELLRPDGHAARHVIAGLRDRAADVDPHDELLRAEIDALPAGVGWLAAAVDELIEAAWGCPQAYERLLAARQRLTVPELYVDAVTPALARLIAGLSGAREHADEYGGVRVADPAAGAGDLLMAVRDQVGEEHSPTFVAAEADPFLARVLRRRLAVHGVPRHDRLVHVAAGLPAGEPAPDMLVARLPYQPMEERGNADPLADVRRITETLAPEQTAVVLGPADLLVGALPPYQPAARTRNGLLAGGRVEAVINLPGGLVSFRPGYETALWVVRREEPSPWQGRVLLADVSDRALTAEVVGALVWDVVTWRRDGHRPSDHARAFGAQVNVSTLTAPRVRLTTRRPPGVHEISKGGIDAVGRAADLESILDELADRGTAVRARVRTGLAAREVGEAAPMTAVGALLKSKTLLAVSGTRIAPADVIPDGQHRVIGSPEVLGRRRPGERTIDRFVLSTRYPRARPSERGDLIVTMAPRFGVYVDHDGFSLVEFPARILRVPAHEQRHLPPRVLAALLIAAHSATRAPGSIRSATRLAEYHLPVLSVAEAEQFYELLARLDERRRPAQREIDALDELARIAADGLTRGTLTIARPSRP